MKRRTHLRIMSVTTQDVPVRGSEVQVWRDLDYEVWWCADDHRVFIDYHGRSSACSEGPVDPERLMVERNGAVLRVYERMDNGIGDLVLEWHPYLSS